MESVNTQDIVDGFLIQKVLSILCCSQRYFVLVRGRHYLLISNPRMQLAGINQDGGWSQEKCRLYCKYAYFIESISYELFYPIFMCNLCFLCLLMYQAVRLTFQISHLWGSMTVRMLPLKVTSKSRKQSSLLGLGTELWIWLVYFIVSFLLAAIQLHQCSV